MSETYEKLGAFYLGKSYDFEAGDHTEDLLLYDSKDLTTHGVCFGMTGSGKTGLCTVLLEEARPQSVSRNPPSSANRGFFWCDRTKRFTGARSAPCRLHDRILKKFLVGLNLHWIRITRRGVNCSNPPQSPFVKGGGLQI